MSAAEQDTARLEAEARQRAQDEAHAAEVAILKAAAEVEATRLQTERDAIKAQAAIDLEAMAQTAVAAREALLAAEAAQQEVEALLEAARAAGLESATRAGQFAAERDAHARDLAVMAQTMVAADLTLTTLREELLAAEALHADTTQQLDAERATVEEARAHLAKLEATIAEAQAEVKRLACEAAESGLQAITHAGQAQDAHRTMEAATAKLAQAEADAEASRLRLADETAAAETARAEKAELAAVIEAQRQAHAARQQAILPVHRDLALDVIGRLVRVDVDRARRNQGSPSKLIAWAEAYYLQAEERYLDALRSFMRAHLVFIGSTEDVDVYTRRLVAPQLLEAVRSIRIVAEGDAEDFPVNLERLLTKWEQDRPAALADRVFQEEMTYVRSL